jgi:tyrosine-protein kinase Etk/Wzc
MEQNQRKLVDYFYILYKWRKFLIINFLLFLILIVVYAFTLSNLYKSTTTVIVLPQNNMGLGSLAGLLGGNNSGLSAGAKLFGLGGNTTEDMILGILNSRSALLKVADEYNLMDYYEIEDRNTDKLLRAFRGDLSFSPNEYAMIDISVVNKDPNVAADIANSLVGILDSINIKLNSEQSRLNRLSIEQRYLKNVNDLKTAEDSMYAFQKKYGIFVVPEQIEVAVKSAAEIESRLAQLEVNLAVAEQSTGINSPGYKLINDQISRLRSKISELKYSENLSDPSNILFPFKNTPDISISYLKNYREIEIQTKIMEVILPLYEHAKFEEQKSAPYVQVLDKADPPELKFAPKRTIIIGGFSILVLSVLVLMSFWGESLVIRGEYRNALDERNSRFFLKVKNIYRIS